MKYKNESLDEQIIEQVNNVLDLIPSREHYKYSLVLHDSIFALLNKEEWINLRNTIQIRCRKGVVHNPWLPEKFIAMVNTSLPVGAEGRIIELNVEGV